jgi:DNA ligase D-like protein (predicted ligase)/DNA ligase D-like protein (predicted 3'-phosphoesterase)
MGPDSFGGERPPPLETYRKKRDPDRTPEPFGGRPSGGRLFVVQKHAARRLHYDLRLEMDGVLKSWAVPRGPSGHVEEKRLAVHVEDHPVEYGDFEGVIPAGNYGAGAVIVWDHGWYRSAKSDAPLTQLERGTLEVEIFGHKMRGRWTLARMSGRESRDWLLLKKADGAALPPGGVEMTERYPQSVQSGLTVEEMADRAGHIAAVRARLDARGAPRGTVEARAQPFALAAQAKAPFADPAWLYEIKYDGVRVLAERRGERVALYGRSGQDTTSRYPEIVRALESLAIDRFVIDGEIVALDASGRPSFQRLQPRMGLTDPGDVAFAAQQRPAVGVFFDCLQLDDRDLRRQPLLDRKECLRWLVPALGTVRYGDHVVGEGVAFYEAASAQRLEGIVAKKARGPYPAGRTRDWIKIKCQRAQAFVIGGYTDPQGARGHFGALNLGVYDGPPDASRLVYVSKVGTGFDEAGLAAIRERLRPLARATAPFEAGATRAGAVITGSSRDWCARCASPSGPRTAACASHRSSGCSTTTIRGRADGRAPSPSMRRPSMRRRPGRRRTVIPSRPRVRSPRPRRRRPPAFSPPTCARSSGPRRATPRRTCSITTSASRRGCCPTCATGPWCSPGSPTASRASPSTRRTPPSSRPRGSAPSGSTPATPSATSPTWWWTTWRCCATWPTARPSRSTAGPRACRRSSVRTGWCSTWIPRARRSPTW